MDIDSPATEVERNFNIDMRIITEKNPRPVKFTLGLIILDN